ncbi:MAG: hypothetical protein JW709_05145 [Sedimentisphaerales bacterium]|nr:hypothetical protein [Sedimentisphaerales bacterium]
MFQKTDTNKIKRKDQEGERLHFSFKATHVAIPSSLNTEAFHDAWEQWHSHRRELKRPLTPTTAKRQLVLLSRQPADIAIAMIEQSLEHGWMGLFPLKNPAAGSAPPNATNGPP